MPYLCYSEPCRSQWSAGGLLRDCEADPRDWRLQQYWLWVYFQEGRDDEEYPAHAHHCYLGADAVQVSDSQANGSSEWIRAPSESSLPIHSSARCLYLLVILIPCTDWPSKRAVSPPESTLALTESFETRPWMPPTCASSIR